MPKGPRGQKLPTDVTGDAVTVARAATGEREETGYRQPARREGGLADAGAGSDVRPGAEERSRTAEAAAQRRWDR